MEKIIMLKKFIGIGFSAVILAGAFGFAATSAAHAESVMKVCGEQWKAAKTAGTTDGKTWNEFLAQCRADQKAAAPDAAPAAEPASAPAAAPAAPAPAPAAAQQPAPDAAPAKPKRKTTAMAAGPGQFATDGEAKAKCPTDTVVWVNSKSKVFHYSSSSAYGKTKKGVYMCEADATTAGAHAAKNEKKS
jgi:hypothetical protein